MPTASSSATSASRKNHVIALRLRIAPRLALAAVFAVLVAGCVSAPPAPPSPPPPPRPAPPSAATLADYTPVAWSALPGWDADAVDEAWPAFRVGCRALVAAARTRELWGAPCAAGDSVNPRTPDAVRRFFQDNFIAYELRAADGAASGLVTGYYEPVLAGSRTRTPAFGVALYAAPDDLLTVDLSAQYPDLAGRRLRGRVEGRRVVPYWSRAEIEAGRAPLADKALVWIADPLDAFFLQIQGSGRIALADGGVMRVGYDDQNGHAYRSIGRILVERGELPLAQATMEGIVDWGRRHPDAIAALLDENASYVFFREVPAPVPGSLDAEIDGPTGALGVPLLRERAVAVDPRAVPLGAPLFLATRFPESRRPLARLVLAQDTGGAIRGAVRADFYWGAGAAAGREAGRMREQGRLWLLWPKDAPPPHATLP